MYVQMPDTDDVQQEEQMLSSAEEDALLRESTASFADWIANFIRRVILLLENLPEEGTDGSLRGGESEGKYSWRKAAIDENLKFFLHRQSKS